MGAAGLSRSVTVFSPLAEEASSPYGATNSGGRPARTRRLLEQSANCATKGPEQRSRKLPESLSRVQHDYGIPSRQLQLNAGLMALQREPAYLKVSVGTPAKGAAGTPSGLGSVRPVALSRFDHVPVSLDPPSERAKRLLKRSAEIGQHVQGCGVHSSCIDVPPDEAVALGASQRVREYLVRDAVQGTVEVLVAAASSGQLGEQHQSPAAADQPDKRIRPSPLAGH